MSTKTKQIRKNYFNIKSLIMKGIEDVREYELPIGTVLIRPLSDLECEQAESILLTSIKDKATREYVFNASERKDLTEVNDILDEVEELEDEDAKKATLEMLNSDINYAELLQAFTKYSLRIAYLSMKDFTDDFKEEDLMKFNGIRELAQEVQRISGFNKDTIEEIEDFRDQ